MKLILITNPKLVIPKSIDHISMSRRPDTYLTKGKVYEGELTPNFLYGSETYQLVDSSYIVRCDDNKLRKFMAKDFMTLEEWREKQLNEIGI